MSILGNSCTLFTRMILITVNLVIYLVLWGLLGTIPDFENNKVEEYRSKMIFNSQVDSTMQNKIDVHGDFDSFDTALEHVYFKQGYLLAKEDLLNLELLRRRARFPPSQEEGGGMAAALDFYEIANEAFSLMDTQNKALLEEFALGINSFRHE